MGGYAGKILYIDLSSKSIKSKSLDKEFARKYIGGLGISIKLYFDLIKENPNFDPFSSDNPFIIMTGPLTGIKMNGVARWTICSKSPLTGLLGDANVGGFFGAELKFAGYDGIVITGQANKPSYIYIDNNTVEIRDAEKYWGKDTYTVNDEIIFDNKQEKKKSGQVLAIGLSGENLVRFASLVNRKGHVAGRCGLGAVLGSKKLKAIFVRGHNKLKTAYPDRFEKLRAELKDIYDENITIEGLRAFGTASHMDLGVISGDIPMKNWQQTEWESFDELGPIVYEEKMLVGKKTCYACGVMCKREAEVKEGPFKFKKGPGPEYETIASFGTMCLNSNIESIGKANEICNRYGMDTITCGSTIAFAIECYENGLITKEDTDGLELVWGNSEAILAMAEKIGKKEGFGAILAQGSEKAAEHIGDKSADFLTTVKGLEAPMHDPRSSHGYGLSYAVSPKGASHMASLIFPIEGGMMYLPEFDELADNIDGMTSEKKAQINIIAQDFGMFFSDCAVFCNIGAVILNATQAVDIINHVTGFDYTIDELVNIGRKIWYFKKGLSNLFGARACDDKLPKRLMTVMSTGPTKGSLPDMDLMLKEFYELREIDDNGIPKKELLEKLELSELAKLLYPA